MPVYNAESYLCQCVDSVLAQSYSDWELLLIDDGSTDNSGKICRKYASMSAKVKVHTQKNKGVSAARNAGLSMARGEYVMFLDADDFLHTQAIEMLVSVVAAYRMDVVIAQQREFRRVTTSLIIQSETPLKSRFRFFTLPPATATRKILYQSVLEPSPWAKLFRRSLFDDFRFKEGIRYEDLDLIPKIVYSARTVCWIPREIYFYRKHDKSFLHEVTFSRADAVSVTAGLADYFAARGPKLLKAAHDRELSANFNIFTLFTRHIDNFPADERDKAEEIRQKTWQRIKELRWGSLTDRRVRLKNKAAILATYIGGRRLIEFLAKKFSLISHS